jgi:hypothetical protein
MTPVDFSTSDHLFASLNTLNLGQDNNTRQKTYFTKVVVLVLLLKIIRGLPQESFPQERPSIFSDPEIQSLVHVLRASCHQT